MTSTAPKTLQGKDADPQPAGWQQRLRRFGYAPRPVIGLRERLVPPYTRPSERLWPVFGIPPAVVNPLLRTAAWGGPLLVALVAGVLRFWNLGSPKAVIFDETYYAKDAWALINQGYEGSWPKDIDKSILRDPSSVPIPTDPGYVVHPPVGKWVIGIGEQLFGFTPFGWRFMVAVLGTLSVLMLCRIGRRLFRSTFLGCLAGALLAVDGLHFVMSRTALLDLVLMFFVLAAFGALVVDRDWARRRLAAALPVDEDGVLRPDATVAETLRLGWRPWRLTAGLMLGLAAATKWNGLYVMAAFGLLTVLWDVGARRTAGAVQPYRAVLKKDLVPAFVSTVPVAIVTYIASWTGWIVTDKGYFRDWAGTAGKGGSFTWLPDWLRSLWHYETEVYQFHVNLTSGHTYQSNPWSWIVLGRPVSYYYESPSAGDRRLPLGRGRQVRVRGPGPRHPAAVVGGLLRDRLHPVALAVPPRLARGRDRVRHRGRVGSVVLLPGAHDLPVLRGGVRAVPVSGGRHDARRDPGPPRARTNAAVRSARSARVCWCC